MSQIFNPSSTICIAISSFTRFTFFLFFIVSLNAQEELKPITPFELDKNSSSDYEQTMGYYSSLADRYPEINIIEAGPSDIGKPIHLVILSKLGYTKPSQIDRSKYAVLLINNAIHPGEPCGVDASMMFARDLIVKPAFKNLLDHTVVLIIPMYNISGALNRSASSRANQNGPKSYGFRGNIRQLDLNRDFIKCISKNAQTFNRLFAHWQPDMMIDNHTSNGADYTYTMTLIATQKDKLAAPLSHLMTTSAIPFLYQSMKNKNWEMAPYVFAPSTPDKGIMGFYDSPRYSSGFAALHHCISFVPETHMFKPFEDRVLSTYAFLMTTMDYLNTNNNALIIAKQKAIAYYKNIKSIPINWALNKQVKDTFLFKGYEAKQKASLIHGQDRLYYDRRSPYVRKIDYWNTYAVTDSVQKPKAYIIPQAYSDVIQRLLNNGVIMERLERDSIMDVSMYYITQYQTSKSPYEGKYLHYDIKTQKTHRTQKYYKGDYWVNVQQDAIRFLIETLEPRAPDSYFAWGYFDGILMQKEHFSSYVFEDLAVELLKNNVELKKAFDEKKTNDSKFAKSAQQQLTFIYMHSKYHENTHNLYPIGRVE